MNEYLMRRRYEVKTEVLEALSEWKDAGGTLDRVLYALEDLIELCIEISESKDK